MLTSKASETIDKIIELSSTNCVTNGELRNRVMQINAQAYMLRQLLTVPPINHLEKPQNDVNCS